MHVPGRVGVPSASSARGPHGAPAVSPPPAASGNRLEAALDRACARWIAWVEGRPGAVLLVILAVTLALAAYAATHLGVNADPRALINEELPFQVRQREFTHAFHTLQDGILVVLDGDSPIAAARAADALAARLRERPDLFAQVDVPGGGPFFARNGLLYLTPEQLEDLTDRLGRVQPFLAQLARDQSIVGIADLIGQALAQAGGNQVRAAKLLGLSRDALRYRMEKYGVGS